MQLNYLEIENFRVIRKSVLRFESRVIGIVGPNGAGKSSIIEAIAWALYGTAAARSGKDEIKSSFAAVGDDCRVGLGFSIRGQDYKVERRLAGRMNRAEVRLFQNGKPYSVGTRETQRAIEQILGLDWQGFKTSFLARQQELNALADLQPAKRRDHLAGMLGIDRLEKAIAGVKEDSRVFQNQIEFLDRQLSNSKAIKEQIVALTGSITESVGREAAARERLDLAVEQLKEKSADLKAVQKDQAEWLQLQGRLNSEAKSSVSLKDRFGKLNQENVELEEAAAEIKRLEAEISEIPELTEKLEQLGQARVTADKSDSLKIEIEKMVASETELARENTELLGQVSEMQKGLKRFPINLEAELAEAEKALDLAREQFTQAKADSVSVGRETDRLEKQLAGVEQFGPDSICDRCLRPLGNDLGKIRGHLEEELGRLRSERAAKKALVDANKETGQKVREAVDGFRAGIKERDRLKFDFSAKSVKKESIEKRLSEIRPRLQELETKLSALPVVVFDPTQLELLKQSMTELVKSRSRRDQLRGAQGRRPVVERELVSVGKSLEESGREIRALEERLKQLGFTQDAYDQRQVLFDQAQTGLDKARRDHAAIEREREVAQKELEEKTGQLEQHKKSEEALEDARSSRFYGEKLATLLGEFRKFLIARIRPTLAHISSELVRQMTDDRYQLVELDEDYNLRLMDSGQYYDLERFSGGEKDLASLCLRLAISQALTESAGLDRSFIILDEVFGSQDEVRRELIVNSLSNLGQSFSQILLITHIDEIKDRVEELFVIEPTGEGWSEVRGTAVG